jgi:pseudouridine-5'-phosphate glycosidase
MKTIVRLPDGRPGVALETTLLAHGVPREHAMGLHRELAAIVAERGATPALVGVVEGRPIVGMTDDELQRLLDKGQAVPKANTANLGVLAHWGADAATTVSATMELAASAGVRVFATGGLGGVHRGLAAQGCNLDISSDLAAMTRFPLAVVTAGVKSLLDVEGTREALETLGVTVVGYRTDAFPAFYLPASAAEVDARFDDAAELAQFLGRELARSGRAVVVANPIPAEHALDAEQFAEWLDEAEAQAEDAGVQGRAVTPFVLAKLHELSAGATLRANIELVKNNARLAGELAARLGRRVPA